MNLNPRTIAELIEGIALAAPVAAELAKRVSTGVHFDSRKILPGNLFFAFSGTNFDGRAFSQSAVDKGAVAILSELPALPGFESIWIQVVEARKALALIARRLFEDPTRSKLSLFGVTGTNGKTTTAYILKSILEAAGANSGLFGTIEYRIGSRILNDKGERLFERPDPAHLACGWCGSRIPAKPGRSGGRKWCSAGCRSAAHLRRRSTAKRAAAGTGDGSMPDRAHEVQSHA